MKTGYSHLHCGLIGEHLSHSFSPLIHGELGDYPFSLCELSPNEVEDFVRHCGLDAFCVTIPYKKAVMPFLDEISDEARAIGSVNVVVRRGGKIYGYNTDYFGFRYMISAAKIEVAGKKAVVLGRGGASLTVCTVLRDMGVRELAILGSKDNTPENVSLHSDAEIVVNATPVGMYPNNGSSPINLDLLPRCSAVLDVIYNPARTALILDAEQRGISTVGGLSMLVAQAAKAFEHFTGEPYEEGCIERIVSEISRNTQNIILVGMPSCGKSTVGKIIAQKTGRAFFDADDEFTRTYSRTPAEVIDGEGEEVFRQMEHSVLCELGKKSGAVIATGGGAVTREYNYRPLHQNGVIVFIERSLSKLTSEGRPLSKGCSAQEMYLARLPLYKRFADIKIESREIPEMTAIAIEAALHKYDYGCIYKQKG